MSDSPVSISSCSSATRSRSRLGARGSGRPGPGWVGPPPTGRVAGRRRRDSGARGAGGCFTGNVKLLSEIPAGRPSERNKRPTQAQRARRRSSQGRAGGQQPGRPGGHTQTPPDDPLSTNDTGTMRQCPRSPDTTTAQADKPQPIPMKPSGKQHALLKVSALGTP